MSGPATFLSEPGMKILIRFVVRRLFALMVLGQASLGKRVGEDSFAGDNLGHCGELQRR